MLYGTPSLTGVKSGMKRSSSVLLVILITAVTAAGADRTSTPTKTRIPNQRVSPTAPPATTDSSTTTAAKSDQVPGVTRRDHLIVAVVLGAVSLLNLSAIAWGLVSSRKAFGQLNGLKQSALQNINRMSSQAELFERSLLSRLEELASKVDSLPREGSIRELIARGNRGNAGDASAEIEGLKKKLAEYKGQSETLDEKRRSLETENARLLADRGKLRCERENLEAEQKRHKQERDSLEARERSLALEKDELRRRFDELVRRESDCRKDQEEAQSRLKKADEQHRLAGLERETAAGDRDEAERFRTEGRAALERTAEEKARVEAVREFFWPPAFHAQGSLVEWRRRLEEKGACSDSAAPMLINAIHRFHLIRLQGAGADPGQVAEAIQEVGRRAYAFWAEEGLDEGGQVEISEAWAKSMESEAGGGFKVRVVRPGQPKDISWMNFRTGGGSHVSRVDTWYVQGPSSTLKASVS